MKRGRISMHYVLHVPVWSLPRWTCSKFPSIVICDVFQPAASHHVEAGGSHSRLMDLHKRDWQWKFMLSAEDRVMHDRGSLYVVLYPHSSDTVSDDLLVDISVKCF